MNGHVGPHGAEDTPVSDNMHGHMGPYEAEDTPASDDMHGHMGPYGAEDTPASGGARPAHHGEGKVCHTSRGPPAAAHGELYEASGEQATVRVDLQACGNCTSVQQQCHCALAARPDC